MFSELLQIKNTEGSNFGTASNVYDVYPTTQDRDIFESVIDGLIVEKYADNEVKEYIKSLSKDKQRVATLSLIGDDHVLWSKINEVVKDRKGGYQRIKEIYLLLRDYVKIADVERKKHGEILTPFKELAEPMVKLVEKYDPEFWKNRNHKVLDSSAGYGTFLILAAYKFMVGLKDEIEDEEERFKWIVENCLYYGELQAKSVFSWLVAIDPHNEYKTNIYWGSFLTKEFDEHCKNVWGVEKFNLIIQNPPYQEQKDGFTKTQPLWHLFVQKSLKLLVENGYMVMVHPSGWRNVDGVFKETQLFLREKQTLELNINSQSKGNDLFGAETRFDFYILKNNLENIETTIIDEDDNTHRLNIKNMEFIPNGMFEFINSLLSSTNRVSVLGDSSYHTQRGYMCKTKSDIYKYPCIYTVAKGDLLKIWYSNRNDNGHFGIPKVIWSNGRVISVGIVIDERGEYGLTQFSYAIVDDLENLKKIKIAMDSQKFRKVMELCSVGVMGINKKVIQNFKKDFWKEFI
jgi:hypothetical protein